MAGCSEMLDDSGSSSGDDDDGSEDDTPSETEASADDQWEAPTWAEWIPADSLADGTDAELGVVDPVGTRAFPNQFDIGEPYREILGLFGVEESAVEDTGIVLRDAGPEPGVITGSFDPDAILSEIRSQSEEAVPTEEYRGVTIVDGFVGLDSEALVLGDTKRRLIDTRYGDSPKAVATSEVFRRVYPPLAEGSFAAMTDGYYDPPFEYSVDASGVSVEGLSRERATLTASLLFENEADAETFVDESGDILEDGSGAVTVESVERSDRFVTATFETTDVSDFLSEDGTTV
jgi:hypothetical protein